MQELKESIVCKNMAACKTCRNKVKGQYWRLMLAQVYRLPGDKVDFECPHGKPWGFSETAKKTKLKQDSADGESRKERHYVLPTEVREKLRDVFLQFRTACYKHRSLHGCTCELQSMGNCGLTSIMKNIGKLECASHHFEDIVINKRFQNFFNES